MSDAPLTVFLAGATGAVGSVFLPRARAAGLRVRPHVRPKTAETHPLGKDPDAVVCDLGDAAAVDAAMRECAAIVCVVGTMRARFAAGDTYETSDHAPVLRLVESARRTAYEPEGGESAASRKLVRHVVLLSSLGARKASTTPPPPRDYLGWKFHAEETVRDSGMLYTVLRPSVFDSRTSGAQPSHGAERKPPPLMAGLFDVLGKLPGLRGMADDVRPIKVEVLADAIVRIVKERGPANTILGGRKLWPLGSGA